MEGVSTTLSSDFSEERYRIEEGYVEGRTPGSLSFY
jgi:hypothetical protein